MLKVSGPLGRNVTSEILPFFPDIVPRELLIPWIPKLLLLCLPFIVSSTVSQRMFFREPILREKPLKDMFCGQTYLEHSIYLLESSNTCGLDTGSRNLW